MMPKISAGTQSVQDVSGTGRSMPTIEHGRARRPKACLLAKNAMLRRYVGDRLAENWSPEQIAGVLRKHEPVGPKVYVSH